MKTKLNGITLEVKEDEYPIHPRNDCDNMGTLLAWHKKYCLGDKNEYSSPKDFLNSDVAKKMYASLPVYMLDHSCIRLSCAKFSDIYDSGRLGIIYCDHEKAKEWLGKDCTVEDVKAALECEVKSYDDFLNSTFYRFEIEGLNGEMLDCGGSFQDNGNTEELLKYMKEFVDKEYYALFDKLANENK